MEKTNNKEYDVLINRYISGDMTDNEKSEFLTSLRESTDFRHRAHVLGLIAREIQHIDSEEDVKSLLGQTCEEDFLQKVEWLRKKKQASNWVKNCNSDGTCCIEPNGKEPKSRKLPVFRKWYYSIAAGIIAIFGIFTVYEHFSGPDMIDIANRQDIVMINYSRGTEDSLMVVKLNRMFNAIKDGNNTSNVVKSLNGLTSSDKNNPTIEYHQTEIFWNLAIGYLKLNKKDEAIKYLNKIVSSAEGTPIAAKAQQLICELE